MSTWTNMFWMSDQVGRLHFNKLCNNEYMNNESIII